MTRNPSAGFHLRAILTGLKVWKTCGSYIFHAFMRKKSMEYLELWNKSTTFAPHLENRCGEVNKTKEVWVSGWNQQFAKLPCALAYRGFESPSFRNVFSLQEMLETGSVHLTVRIQDSQSWHKSSILLPSTRLLLLQRKANDGGFI